MTEQSTIDRGAGGMERATIRIRYCAEPHSRAGATFASWLEIHYQQRACLTAIRAKMGLM